MKYFLTVSSTSIMCRRNLTRVQDFILINHTCYTVVIKFAVSFIPTCSTKHVEKSKELVIPLIQKNRWYRHEAVKHEDEKEAPPGEQQDSVESQAIKELIEGVILCFLPHSSDRKL